MGSHPSTNDFHSLDHPSLLRHPPGQGIIMSGPNAFRPVINPFITKQIGKSKFPPIMTPREALAIGRSRNQLDTIDNSASSSTLMPIKIDKPPSPPPTAEGMFKLDVLTGTLPIRGDQTWGYTLDNEMKEFYMLKAAVAKERYNAKLEIWRNGLSTGERRTLRKVDPEESQLTAARSSITGMLDVGFAERPPEVSPDPIPSIPDEDLLSELKQVEAEEQSTTEIPIQVETTTELKKRVIASILETEELSRQRPDSNSTNAQPKPASYLTYRHLLDEKVRR